MKKQFTRRVLALLLLLALLGSFGFAFAANVPTEQEAYQTMIALKSQYPEGMHWTNDNSYTSRGLMNLDGHDYTYTGRGCVGFALILSDAVFGDTPGRKLYNVPYEDLRVSDILRINGDTHSVIILEIYSDHVVIAEGNYNSSIHWGRTLTKEQVMAADYVLTRWPSGSTAPERPDPTPTPTPEPTPTPSTDPDLDGYTLEDVTFVIPTKTDYTVSDTTIDTGGGEFRFTYTKGTSSMVVGCPLWDDMVEPLDAFPTGKAGIVTIKAYCDQPDDPETVWTATYNIFVEFTDVTDDYLYYYDPVYWALDTGVTTGMTPQLFGPDSTVTRGQAVTFLWRAMGEPEPQSGRNPFADVKSSDYYYKAVLWAVENNITVGTSTTTFSPDQTCSSAHIITFLYRTLYEDVDGWYQEAAEWADYNDLLEDTGLSVRPDEMCPRRDVVTFLFRVLY